MRGSLVSPWIISASPNVIHHVRTCHSTTMFCYRCELAWVAALLLSVSGRSSAYESFFETFHSANTTRWSISDAIEHCNDGACFKGRPDHLQFNASFPDEDHRGVRFTLDQTPCRSNASACCDGTKCAMYASGHLRTIATFRYGYVRSKIRIGHRPAQAMTSPNNTFTCFSAYTDDPFHNEMAICWNTSSTQIHFAYWYDSKMHREILPLGFDATQDFHVYGFNWLPDRIEWIVDDQVRHTSHGEVNKTIPYLPTQLVHILRPLSLPWDGPAVMDIIWTNLTVYDRDGGDNS
eukprot:TRINITY_DN7168_c0_g1_i1.p2 TRINITY_DN7168_c0_g1~~TRINITY_DN7168_c0_g1_i1.p2  ORF type:complete len:292 (+),score=4.61 TRINITY_DN7168_c0_g1_i1:1378-2253(+)